MHFRVNKFEEKKNQQTHQTDVDDMHNAENGCLLHDSLPFSLSYFWSLSLFLAHLEHHYKCMHVKRFPPECSTFLQCSAAAAVIDNYNIGDVPNFIKNHYFYFFLVKIGPSAWRCVRIQLNATFLVHFFIHLLVEFLFHIFLLLSNSIHRTISQHHVYVNYTWSFAAYAVLKQSKYIFQPRGGIFFLLLLFLWLASLPEQKSDYKPNRRFFRYTDQTAHAIEAIDMSTAIACLLFDEAIFIHFLSFDLSLLLLTNLLLLLENQKKKIVHQNKCMFSCSKLSLMEKMAKSVRTVNIT